MSTHKSNEEPDSQNKKIDLKGLEPLLRKCLKNEELQVVNYTATRLLPPGENYCSIMVKLDIKLRKKESAKEEMMHLVAKTPSCNDNTLVEWPLVFKKELFMYAEIRPLYRELERDAGIEKSGLIDVWPEYVGYRNSLNDDNKIDENSLMLMENIIAEGYYNLDKQFGLDIHHGRIALTSLARYHALGIAMKQKRPVFAKISEEQARVLGINFAQLDEGFDGVCQTFLTSPPLQKHLSIIKSSFEQMREGGTWKTEPTEPWATITHGDFWTNNILFHKDEGGNVDDVKFVDFQTYLYHSPLKDLPYFLGGSLDRLTQMNHLDELIALYYNTFIKTLRRMDCDTTPFTKESFERELKIQAINELPLCALAVKFFAAEIEGDDKSNEEVMNNIFQAEASVAYIDRLLWLVDIYEKMGWL